MMAAGTWSVRDGGLSAGAAGVREDVEIGERMLLDEGEGGFVIGFGFAGEAGDDVGADGGIGNLFADEFEAAGVVFGAVPAVHGGEDGVGGGLQGHVEVAGEAIGGGEEGDQVGGNVHRLDGADAEARDLGFVEDAAEEIFEFGARSEVAAVHAEVDAAEDDFLVACGGELADFVEDLLRRKTAAFAADERNHAIGAAEVAAVLDFEDGARVIGFAAEDWSGKEGGLLEDVAGENFRVVRRRVAGLGHRQKCLCYRVGRLDIGLEVRFKPAPLNPKGAAPAR